MSTVPLLQLEEVSVGVGETPICHEVSLTIQEGETHVLLGPNGSLVLCTQISPLSKAT